jgi:hypothetical protein
MTANIAFSLAGAAVSLTIVVLAAAKGDWPVVAVYAALLAGFLARAHFGRAARRRSARPPPRGGPEHQSERPLRRGRFRRR